MGSRSALLVVVLTIVLFTVAASIPRNRLHRQSSTVHKVGRPTEGVRANIIKGVNGREKLSRQLKEKRAGHFVRGSSRRDRYPRRVSMDKEEARKATIAKAAMKAGDNKVMSQEEVQAAVKQMMKKATVQGGSVDPGFGVKLKKKEESSK